MITDAEKVYEADLSMVLEAREQRSFMQQTLLKKYNRPLVSFSMNIAGPIKYTRLIHRGFNAGHTALLSAIKANSGHILFQKTITEITGCEGMYVTDLDAGTLKKITTAIEESTPLGRLFDLDVLDTDGNKLERSTARTCLICGRPAKECARSRTHSVAELQAATKQLLTDELNRRDMETITQKAIQALLYEVCVTPKPGLVDRRDSGSHRDMDIYTFMTSAVSLYPYFRQCVQTGIETADRTAPMTLQALRPIGMDAETKMYTATKGINTHKGAIFSMGILCAACGRLSPQYRNDPDRILAEAAKMAEGIVEKELKTNNTQKTAGQKIYAEYQIGGIRQEAEAGFPSVREYGLPVLEKQLKQGKTNDEAGCAALLSILAHTPDTNMISRGGIEKQKQAAKQAAELLNDFTAEALDEMNRVFINDNLSPGGSADLLALTWFLHFVKETD